MNTKDPKTNSLQLNNIVEVTRLIEKALHYSMDSANEATNQGIKLSFDEQHFKTQYKGQLSPELNAYLNIPPKRNGLFQAIGFKVGRTIGILCESGEFALSLTPFIGKSIYSGMKYGHVNAYTTHTKLCNKVNISLSEVKQTSEKAMELINHSISDLAETGEELIMGTNESPPLAHA